MEQLFYVTSLKNRHFTVGLLAFTITNGLKAGLGKREDKTKKR
jgi:hypothetical protein